MILVFEKKSPWWMLFREREGNDGVLIREVLALGDVIRVSPCLVMLFRHLGDVIQGDKKELTRRLSYFVMFVIARWSTRAIRRTNQSSPGLKALRSIATLNQWGCCLILKDILYRVATKLLHTDIYSRSIRSTMHIGSSYLIVQVAVVTLQLCH